MKRKMAAVILIFLVILSILFGFSPDVLSRVFLGFMTAVVLWGCSFGIFPVLQYIEAFDRAREKIVKISQVQTDSAWISLQREESLFGQKTLNALFEDYSAKASRQNQNGQIVSDIEEVFNEDSLMLRSWWGVVHQIPGTLTAIGLLGTFIGLIIGISSVGFSSVDATLSSISYLLSGIRLAFYTSIAGVILSIIFNLIHQFVWNLLLRQLGMFCETFHGTVFSNTEEQLRTQNQNAMAEVLNCLKRLPKEDAYSTGSAGVVYASDVSNEQRMMPDIQAGFSKGEFIFLIQPKYNLATKKIVGGEALLRWEHGEFGMIYPSAFMNVVERNGFVVRIDRYIWEEVCKTIRKWVDKGIRPMPISVNISKTDIMAMDVPGVFLELMKKYGLSPRCLELEIAENAYLDVETAARETETQLRKNGFKVIIDGFDEEFLAMSVMKTTQADALKLDLRYMGTDSDKRESCVSSMFEQARKLNIPVLAKCIESAEQLSDLRRCGCTEGQGNFLKKPVTIEEFEHLTE